MKPSPDYLRALELSKEQHRESKTYSGKFVRPYRGEIAAIITRLGCKTALDYGCGKGLQYSWVSPEGLTLEQFWGLEVQKYDPAHPDFDTEPVGSFDIVICSHVLNVIPLPDLDWVIDRLYSLADKAVFIVNAVCSPPQKPNKARWRVENTAVNWTTAEWLERLASRKTKPIEVHLVTKSKDPTQMVGEFVV